VDTNSKPKVGRPRSPLEVADARELARTAALAASVLSVLRRSGRGMYDSERDLRSWLATDEISFTSSDLAPALGLLELTSKIGRHAAKPNMPRAGWLIVNGNGATSPTPEPVEAAEDAPEPTEQDRIDALATAIVRAFIPGRGYQGNVTVCESEAVLREWLASDGFEFDEADLPAALTKLETATLPGSTSRLLRGYALHRSYPITTKPLPKRAMQLLPLHPFDRLEYSPADIEPYVV
jgi:hypothetical protein